MDDKLHHWIIAIDGPSGAGKSTVAKRLAKHLKFTYIDTGAMYRAIGLKALHHNPKLDNPLQIASIARDSVIDLTDSPEGYRVLLDGEDVTQAIRAELVSQAASI